MADSHDAFIELLDRGRVATGEDLAEWLGLDPAHVRDPVSIHMAPLGAPLPADLPTRWERPCR
jgi:hypothetical protein